MDPLTIAVKDEFGVVHKLAYPPLAFTTRPGGMSGVTGCGKRLYDKNLGSLSCSAPMEARPMEITDDNVDCMVCIANEARP